MQMSRAALTHPTLVLIRTIRYTPATLQIARYPHLQLHGNISKHTLGASRRFALEPFTPLRDSP
jgi:hypothetical protein